MGDTQYKPGFYWDFREARWVRHTDPVVPAPTQPVDDAIAETVEADAPAG